MLRKLSALYGLVRADARILWFALRHPERPPWLWPAVALLALYLVSPVDLIPETLPVIGLVDDLVLIPLAMSWLVSRLPARLRAQYDAGTDAR